MSTTLIVCNNCGTDADAGANFCPKCGAPTKSSTCRACGSVQPAGNQFCSKCGANRAQTPPVLSTTTKVPEPEFAGYSRYYQQEFKNIKSSGEAYKGKWNWAAFSFGG